MSGTTAAFRAATATAPVDPSLTGGASRLFRRGASSMTVAGEVEGIPEEGLCEGSCSLSEESLAV